MTGGVRAPYDRRSVARLDPVNGRDWQAWHDPYADPGSPLSRRLRLIQQHINAWLDERPDAAVTVASACAGQGHDLLGVLSARSDSGRVRATLVELDEGNVAVAREVVDTAELDQVEVMCADAGLRETYLGAVPADLVLLAGVFGNISDADVGRTVAALPQLCASGATVIWTRTRRGPDLTPQLRQWFQRAGFVEEAFEAPDDVLFSVGVHRRVTAPQPLQVEGRLFQFS